MDIQLESTRRQILNTVLPVGHINRAEYANNVVLIKDIIDRGIPITSPKLTCWFEILHTYTLVDAENVAVGGKYKRKTMRRKSNKRKSMIRQKRR